MIKDLVFIINKNSTMCRKIKQVKDCVEQEILNLNSNDTNRITVVEIDNGWDYVLKQVLVQQFKYKFKPYRITEPILDSLYMNSLCPVLLDLEEDMNDSDQVNVLFLTDESVEGTSIFFTLEDVKNLVAQLGWSCNFPIYSPILKIASPWMISTSQPAISGGTITYPGVVFGDNVGNYTVANKK